MADVTIGFGDRARDTAAELLGAASVLKLDPSVVKTTFEGFNVPQAVADKAGYGKKPSAKRSKNDESAQE